MRLTPMGAREMVCGVALFLMAAALFVWLSRRFDSPWLLLPVVPLFLVLLWLFWFFRDPTRSVPATPGIIVSPADGTVTHLDEADEPDYIGGRARRCSIFLSVFSVHLNRAPAAGTVAAKTFRPGAFFDARREESLVKNQNQDIGLAVTEPGLPSRMVVRQSTGAIARNIVCPVAIGTALGRGEVYGMIKFGSRTTLFLSPDADIQWHVRPGDKVKAGETVLASVRAPEGREEERCEN
ncbi:MAG: phosphatidylserine decarboxylase [Planctomycetes bacterium]|nr:phosphatidylserine decarboxylase [Planctomycetota bacterium]